MERARNINLRTTFVNALLSGVSSLAPLFVPLIRTPLLTPDQYAKANRRREGAARAKIRTALNNMLAEGKHPTIKNMALATGCRKETVKKHSDIWAIYATRNETRLSTGLGDLSGGVGGISLIPVLSASLFSEENSFIPSVQPEGEFEIFGSVLDGGLAEFSDLSLSCLEVSVSRPVSGAFSPNEFFLSSGSLGISHKNTKTSPKLLGISSGSFSLSDSSEEVEFLRQSYSRVGNDSCKTGPFGSWKEALISPSSYSCGWTNFEMSLAEDQEPSVAPLFHGWRESLPESPQHKDQALRVAAQVLTLGPLLSGIQPLRHVTTGGFVLELAVMPVQLGIYLGANSVYVEPVSSIVTKLLPHSPIVRGYLTTVPLCKHEIYGSLSNLCGTTRHLCSIGKQPIVSHFGNNSIRGP